MKIKVSDYIAKFYASKGIDTVFVLTGGCIVHMIDSLALNPDINYVPMLHEQSAAMAADGYARISGKPGLIAATSGPGATNLLTGICCSYYDSIPVIAITGQVPSGQLKRNVPTRQLGFQETDVVSIYAPVTKYSRLVEDPRRIRYELEKSFHIATTGRQGPVLLDICEDVLFAFVEEDELEGYIPSQEKRTPAISKARLQQVLDMVIEAERPIVILGGGIRQGSDVEKCRAFIEKLNLPVVLTWGAFDVIGHDHPLFAGGFGVTSGRAGNFVVQNSDFILAIGTRFDTHEIGTKAGEFARVAKRVVVDLDEGEFKKFESVGLRVDLPFLASANEFIAAMGPLLEDASPRSTTQWRAQISDWKRRYPICTDEHRAQSSEVNPYVFFDILGKVLPPSALVVTDCGSNLIWTMQGMRIKDGQRVISAFNHSPMGYSVPAAIGAAFANPDRSVICVIGDGGFHINSQDLAIIEKHNLDIKIFVMNNHCHGIIQGTQNAWLEGRHHASDPVRGGLPDPDISLIARAYGLQTVDVHNHAEIPVLLQTVLGTRKPKLVNLHMRRENQIEPKLMFGRPIEDSHPLLPREELEFNMRLSAPVVNR